MNSTDTTACPNMPVWMGKQQLAAQFDIEDSMAALHSIIAKYSIDAAALTVECGTA